MCIRDRFSCTQTGCQQLWHQQRWSEDFTFMTLSLPAVMMTFFMGSCIMVSISEPGWACQWCMRCGVVEAPILTSHTHTHPSKPAKQFHCLSSVLLYVQSFVCFSSATHPSIPVSTHPSTHTLNQICNHTFSQPLLSPFVHVRMTYMSYLRDECKYSWVTPSMQFLLNKAWSPAYYTKHPWSINASRCMANHDPKNAVRYRLQATPAARGPREEAISN